MWTTPVNRFGVFCPTVSDHPRGCWKESSATLSQDLDQCIYRCGDADLRGARSRGAILVRTLRPDFTSNSGRSGVDGRDAAVHGCRLVESRAGPGRWSKELCAVEQAGLVGGPTEINRMSPIECASSYPQEHSVQAPSGLV